MTQDNIPRGLLFILVGPGGAGKNALMRRALAQRPDLKKLVTATTRPIRTHETEGISHYFVSPDTFRHMIASDELLEYQEVTKDKFYGILRAPVDNALNTGQDLIADIDVLGAKIVRQTYPHNTILTFITVPGETTRDKLDVLRQRMRNPDRAEADELIQQRLDRARDLELPFADECDYVIINADNDMETALDELLRIIQQEQKKRQSIVEQ